MTCSRGGPGTERGDRTYRAGRVRAGRAARSGARASASPIMCVSKDALCGDMDVSDVGRWMMFLLSTNVFLLGLSENRIGGPGKS